MPKHGSIFTATETRRLVKDGQPRTATSTLTVTAPELTRMTDCDWLESGHGVSRYDITAADCNWLASVGGGGGEGAGRGVRVDVLC